MPPRHTRTSRSFLATFGRSADDALSSMDAAGDDIAEQQPTHPAPLVAMGMTRRHVPVTIADPFGGAEPTTMACEVAVSVPLAAHRRGIHVSRMSDAVARHVLTPHDTLLACAEAMWQTVRETQGADTADVRLHGTLSYLEEVSGRTHKWSLEHLELGAGVAGGAGAAQREVSIGFTFITACPCVQETLKHARGGVSVSGSPRLTHSQRCRASITIHNPAVPIDLVAALGVIDGVVMRSQNTRPRDVELLAVHRAHERPQFVEDVLRDLLQAVRAFVPEAMVRIEASSMESIHDFDLAGSIEGGPR